MDENIIQKKTKRSGSLIKIIIIVAIIAIVIAGITVGTMWFIKKTEADKDQLVANEVIAMIGMLDDKTITVDDEIEIERIKNKYYALTVAQKKLVSNRKVLDEVTDALEKAKVNEGVEKEKKANQDAADEVIRLIETLKEKTVTVDSENEITLIKMKYDALTRTQKDLVTNYSDLVTATNALDTAKDQKAADEVIRAIDSVDSYSLGTDDTQINMLFSQYEALTEEQKALVTNYDKLLGYQNTIKANESRQATVNNGVNLANNFPGYTGKWGNFGAHINGYQGMIEAVVKRDANLRGHFKCNPNPNYLDMYVSRFTRDTGGFGIGRCTITFTGYDKDEGYIATLYGEIVIKSDGTLYFSKTYYA
ncbi:MAG: hypothetical protein IJA55_08310 [Clostridia bacterium]|nr:hypothetical protein [Clostridia bacterium]